MVRDEMLTQERLKELLDYDPETGIFTHRVSRGRRVAGVVTNCATTGGYIKLSICNKRYYAHRVAWIYVHGRWPSEQIDHINHVTSDNRIANLREATRSQNSANSGPRRNNKSGKKGVFFLRQTGKWRASIRKDKRRIYLGCFDTVEEAHASYAAAARDIHGEFARAE
jgi:hypothetical protein